MEAALRPDLSRFHYFETQGCTMSTPALTPTPDTPSRHNPTDTLITQLSVGPDLRDVAAVLLR